MGRKASYRRNNVKEAVNDETAVKNVETVKEKFFDEHLEKIKSEAAVTAKAATEKEAEQPKPRRGRPKKSETAAKETAAKAKTPVKKPAGRSKKSTEAKKEFVIQFEGKSLNNCYYVADEKITGDVALF